MSITDRLNYVKMKARHQALLLPWYKKWWGIVIIICIIIIFAIVIFSTVYVVKKIQEIRSGQDIETIEKRGEEYFQNIKGDGSNYMLGVPRNSDKSTIEIIQFGNFSCQYSAISAPAIKKLVEEKPDQIRLIYRDYPGQESIILALGARCAGEQNKFWEMHDMLFEFQDDLSTLLEDEEKREFLIQMSELLDLNKEQFTKCLDEKKYLDKIKRDYDDGNKLQILGTPTWFINGYQITGALDEDALKTMLSGLIK